MGRSFAEPDREPPLDRDGELELPADLADLANQLRGDAARVAEAGLPQAAAQRLWARPARRRQQRWIAARPVLALGATVVVLTGVLFRVAGAPRDAADQPPEGRNAIERPAAALTAEPRAAARGVPGSDAESVAGPNAPGSVFLSSTGATPAEDAWSEQLATPEEKIQLLEEAVERYRSAVVYQQDRLLRAEAELQRAEQEIRQLRDELARRAPAAGAATAPATAAGAVSSPGNRDNR